MLGLKGEGKRKGGDKDNLGFKKNLIGERGGEKFLRTLRKRKKRNLYLSPVFKSYA